MSGTLLPLFPLGTVLFPGVVLPLHVFEPRYRALVDDLLAEPEPRSFGVVAIRAGHEVGTDAVRALYDVGCIAEVRRVQRLPDGRSMLVTVGGRRFRLGAVDRSRPYLQADVEWLDEPAGDAALRGAAEVTARGFAAYLDALDSTEVAAGAQLSVDDPTALSYAVAASLVVDLPERQALLECADTAGRLRAEAEMLAREVAVMRKLHAVPLPKPPLPSHRLN